MIASLAPSPPVPELHPNLLPKRLPFLFLDTFEPDEAFGAHLGPFRLGVPGAWVNLAPQQQRFKRVVTSCVTFSLKGVKVPDAKRILEPVILELTAVATTQDFWRD